MCVCRVVSAALMPLVMYRKPGFVLTFALVTVFEPSNHVLLLSTFRGV